MTVAMKCSAWMGVDPGSSGAIAVIDSASKIVSVVKGTETPADISEFVAAIAAQYDVCAMLEQVSSMPKQGVSSTFKFGASYGFLTGLLVAHRVRFERVTPQVWQRALKCLSGGNKNITKQAAQALWPDASITHATADALLIAEYSRRKNERTAHNT